MKAIITVLVGLAFGWILIEAQAFSWYRIQEMFHFRSFHMFGVLFSAIATGAIAVYLIKKFKIKNIEGQVIEIKPKQLNLSSNVFGGIIFGLGWSIAGACTAPVYILTGLHWPIGIVLLIGAILGTVLFALFNQLTTKK
ncbi:MAG: YeeE/YedE family protein [Bacteroidetes bacterium]|nr:MAG: YeeE/YedE family protein [Bacteroidota bacterium]